MPQLRLVTLCKGLLGLTGKWVVLSCSFTSTCEHLEDKLLHQEEENHRGSPSPLPWAVRIHNQHHPEAPSAEQPGAPEAQLGAAVTATGSIPVPFPATPADAPLAQRGRSFRCSPAAPRFCSPGAAAQLLASPKATFEQEPSPRQWGGSLFLQPSKSNPDMTEV